MTNFNHDQPTPAKKYKPPTCQGCRQRQKDGSDPKVRLRQLPDKLQRKNHSSWIKWLQFRDEGMVSSLMMGWWCWWWRLRSSDHAGPKAAHRAGSLPRDQVAGEEWRSPGGPSHTRLNFFPKAAFWPIVPHLLDCGIGWARSGWNWGSQACEESWNQVDTDYL